MPQFYTYLHCKPDGTPFYVGKGHGPRACHFHNRNVHHRNVVAKYGEASILIFKFPCDSEAQAFSDEVQQIAQLRRDGVVLVNICSGGEGACGAIHSKEAREKRSRSLKGRVFSEETRAKLSIAAKGKVGHPLSEATRAKLSAANKGKSKPPISDETREKMSKSRMGKTASPETRKRISTACSGRKVSSETRAKLSQSVAAAWASGAYIGVKTGPKPRLTD